MLKLKQSIQKKVDSILKNPQIQFNSSLHQTFFNDIFSPEFYDLLNSLLENKQIWYLRHAQSPINQYYQDADNFGKPYYEQQKYFDPSITQKGEEQLAKLPIMYFDVAYISPMTRTLETFSNLNVKLRKQPIVTPLIREKTRALAGVVGSSKQVIEKRFPALRYEWNQNNEYWWRHDYKNQAYSNITNETNLSFKARIAFFLLCILLEGSLKMLVVSHMAFYDIIHKSEYFQKPANARLLQIEHKDIINLFRRVERRIPKPKL